MYTWKRVVSNSFNRLNPILKTFWLLVGCKFFLMDCNCTIFHSAANHAIILVRKLLEIFLEWLCINYQSVSHHFDVLTYSDSQCIWLLVECNTLQWTASVFVIVPPIFSLARKLLGNYFLVSGSIETTEKDWFHMFCCAESNFQSIFGFWLSEFFIIHSTICICHSATMILLLLES